MNCFGTTRKVEFNVLLNKTSVEGAQVTSTAIHTEQATNITLPPSPTLRVINQSFFHPTVTLTPSPALQAHIPRSEGPLKLGLKVAGCELPYVGTRN